MLGGSGGVGRRDLGRASLERYFDATMAHASGFRQPVDLLEALAATARSEGALSLLVHKARA